MSSLANPAESSGERARWEFSGYFLEIYPKLQEDSYLKPESRKGEIAMRIKYAILLFVPLVTFLWLFSTISKTTTAATKETLYGAYIDELVLKCKPKAARCNSGSRNIRQQSALYCLKAAYCNYHKTELVKEMVEADVGVKKHQIHYYLNKNFFYTLRTASKTLDS